MTAYGNLVWRRQPGSLPSRTIPAVRRHSSALRRLVGRLQGGRDTMRRLLGDVRCRIVGQSGLADKSSPKMAMVRPNVLDVVEVGSLGYCSSETLAG